VMSDKEYEERCECPVYVDLQCPWKPRAAGDVVGNEELNVERQANCTHQPACFARRDAVLTEDVVRALRWWSMKFMAYKDERRKSLQPTHYFRPHVQELALREGMFNQATGALTETWIAEHPATIEVGTSNDAILRGPSHRGPKRTFALTNDTEEEREAPLYPKVTPAPELPDTRAFPVFENPWNWFPFPYTYDQCVDDVKNKVDLPALAAIKLKKQMKAAAAASRNSGGGSSGGGKRKSQRTAGKGGGGGGGGKRAKKRTK
jgi:hypothetical protein